MNKVSLLAVLALSALGGVARSDVIAYTDPANRGPVTYTKVNNKWRVTYQRDGSANDVSLWVQGLTSDTIEYVRISNSGGGAAYKTFIYIEGYNPGAPTGPVEEVTETSGNGTTLIQELIVQGNLGGSVDPCIKTDRIVFADVAGNVTKGIELNNSPSTRCMSAVTSLAISPSSSPHSSP